MGDKKTQRSVTIEEYQDIFLKVEDSRNSSGEFRQRVDELLEEEDIDPEEFEDAVETVQTSSLSLDDVIDQARSSKHFLEIVDTHTQLQS